MNTWPDGTPRSTNNAFTMTSGRSVMFEDRNNIKVSMNVSQYVEKKRKKGVDVGNIAGLSKRINIEPRNFHVYSKVKK